MKFWISKNSEVSIKEQIATQVRMGVASGDLAPGEKLPSVRELARRFAIHPNTISAAYRGLSEEGLITAKQGSGAFVADAARRDGPPMDIDSLVSSFVASATAVGFGPDEIRVAMLRWLESGPMPKVLVVESDLRLREIVAEEVRLWTEAEIEGIGYEEFAAGAGDTACVVAALFDEREKLTPHVANGRKAVFLNVNSVPASLSGAGKPASDDLIAIVSGWNKFLAFARVYLLAARVPPETLIFRSTAEPGWMSGLDAASIVICDSYTASALGDDPRLRVFRLLKDESIRELKNALL